MPDYATTVDIDAPPDIVFNHLVTVEGMLAWMGQHARLDATPGGEFQVDVNGVPIRGQYVRIDRPHRVTVSWGVAGSDEFPPGSSTVDFVLTAIGTGTRLELVHTGIPDSRLAGYSTGWAGFLAQLQGCVRAAAS
jgi:uncharacterized protein YndB with AHSA1/START domain